MNSKKRLDIILKKIKKGKILVIKEKESPVAKVAPIDTKIYGKKPVGLAKDDFIVPDDFNLPLPSETIRIFEE